MAANEKQLEKVTLTLTNKTVGSQAGPLAATSKLSIRQQEHQSNTCTYIRGRHTPTRSAANRARIQSHPGSPVSTATDFNRINWGESFRNGHEECKIFNPLHSARLFQAFHVHLEVYKTTHTHTLWLYLPHLWLYYNL